MVSYCYASLLFVVVWMVVVPIQVQVRLKDDFTIPVNTEPTSASAILLRNHRIFFEDMKKALEFLMDVADTKPDHKALGGKVCRDGSW